MKNMKVLALDIDGVMTDGTKLYDGDATCVAKRFNDKDFTAIKLFKKLGVEVCFISSDETVNRNMAKKRGIEFYYSRLDDGSISKKQFVPLLGKQLKDKDEDTQWRRRGPNCEIYYVGDDFYDLDIMMELPRNNRICPSDSPEYIKRMCGCVCETKGGEGIVAEILTKYLDKANKFDEVYDLV